MVTSQVWEEVFQSLKPSFLDSLCAIEDVKMMVPPQTLGRATTHDCQLFDMGENYISMPIRLML